MPKASAAAKDPAIIRIDALKRAGWTGEQIVSLFKREKEEAKARQDERRALSREKRKGRTNVR